MRKLVGREYVLSTAACNEEAHIERLLSSVVQQTLLPIKWVVVSDGSTDRTDEIVIKYARRHAFIHLHRMTNAHSRSFAAQVNAINAGFALCREVSFSYIGNLDADISLHPFYFERLIDKFGSNPSLGIAGGFIYEDSGGEFRSRKSNNARSVAHALQLFRRECFEELGGYVPLPYGGPDWHAEVSARMRGWTVEAFTDLPAFHHRPTGTAGGLLRYWYRQGLMDYSLGSHPVFEVVKLLRRLPRKPFAAGAVARLSGFAAAYCRGYARVVPEEFVSFLQREQTARLRLAARKLFGVPADHSSNNRRGVVR